MLSFSTYLNSAPYNTKLLLLFIDGTISTGMKIKKDWVKSQGTEREIKGSSLIYVAFGIDTSYDAEPYFENDPIGFIQLDTIKYNFR